MAKADQVTTNENVHRLQRAAEPPAAERQQDGAPPQARTRDVPPAEAPALNPASGSPEKHRTFPKRQVPFALLPVVLVIGAWAYVTGGATMTTDNAYVQADMVGVANDVAGIVGTIAVKE